MEILAEEMKGPSLASEGLKRNPGLGLVVVVSLSPILSSYPVTTPTLPRFLVALSVDYQPMATFEHGTELL